MTIRLLLAFIRGLNVVSLRAIRSRTFSSMILWRPTKGGVEHQCVCVPLLTLLYRVSRYCLKDDQFVCRNLRGLLERGVQKAMDPEEPKGPVDPSVPPLAIETMLGYTHWGQRGSYLAGTLRVCSEFLNNLSTLYPVGKC